MIKQSFSWWGFANQGVDDETLLREAKAIGYDGVELLPPTLFQQAVDLGLSIVTHGGHDSISSGFNDLSQHDRIEKEILALLPVAAKFQIPSLIVFSGDRRDDLSDAQGLENTVIGLRRVATAAQDAGVTLILELLNSKVDHHGYQADHTAWGAEACRRVGSAHVKLLYDIYHMQIMEGNLIQTIRDHHEYFGHYHTAGNPGRGDIDPATQEISYAPIFRAIAATGYDGYIGHEFVSRGAPLAMLRSAYDLTRDAFSSR
ncbi:hydroxypyruvate isomerase [Capsulimonas corticalis]|uniref:Hydroxypyruvate isomerase n=1 Tax=Capsulimonas corticalis TaxID=2219043 RepID=A0A402D5W8_9BACT|nr:TIM barrel protein [Capsulimonas corticalis]BDI32527.1 hydroxypyruvate isomerase [Capsulimonas corticalis]